MHREIQQNMLTTHSATNSNIFTRIHHMIFLSPVYVNVSSHCVSCKIGVYWGVYESK
jgi:hypothetical protein